MKKASLRHIGVFSKMSEQSLESLAHIARFQCISKDEIVYYEGELLYSAYFLINGLVELYKMDKNDNELFLCYVDSKNEHNRLINSFSAFKPYEASASVHALLDSELVLFDLTQLQELIHHNLEVSNALLYAIIDKGNVFKQFINSKEMYDSSARVAHLLFTQPKYFNQTQRQVIARELNIKLETLSRILQKMLQQNLIAKNAHGDIYISDMQAFVATFAI
ncbi:cyclic nucleotide-binding domain-containing protein [Helicobacter jaachi]|uniref:Cyclic nucleotide-binding domain-containing protein n=1 Tax=Helicobacter jaachi TaxID=1677920 RepID=A0A4U8TDH9_9HELI|nr:cyclic nucleotide-binding domain-containing protein [Helicobacter jaachi]TLD97734.1 cyclic nucleotide-binding domain-containing protein [Helicobacter jaachi]